MDKLKQELLDLGINYQGATKYYTNCPKCSDERKKKGTKSLLVQLGNDAHVRCFHPGCEWNRPHKLGHIGEVVVEQIKNIPFEDSSLLPPLPEGAISEAYTDKLGQILMYIVRTADKQFFPLSLTESGNVVFNAVTDKTLLYLGDRSWDQVIVVEGEKAARALHNTFVAKKVKVAVVTWPGGAGGTARGDWAQLAGKNVILWPDNDAAGIAAMQQIAGVVAPSRLRQVIVSKLPAKSDAADFSAEDQITVLRDLEELGELEDGYNLDTYEEFVKNYRPGPSLGWKEVDQEVTLPSSGVVVVSGRSGHGKSTSMINIIVQLLKTTERKVVFYSMELTVEQVIEKMINILDDSCVYKSKEATLNDHYKWLKEKSRSGQLQLVGKRLSLKKILAGVAKPIYRGAVVFIDYIQIMATENQSADARYREIQNQVYTMKDEATKNELIFFIGSQLTPGEYSPDADKSRESADINNVADLHLKVWNKQAARAAGALRRVKRDGNEETEDWYDEVKAEIVFSVVKNRWGRSGQRFGMHLDAGVRLTPATKASNVREIMETIESEY